METLDCATEDCANETQSYYMLDLNDRELIQGITDYLYSDGQYPVEKYRELCRAVHDRLENLPEYFYNLPGMRKKVLDILSKFKLLHEEYAYSGARGEITRRRMAIGEAARKRIEAARKRTETDEKN